MSNKPTISIEIKHRESDRRIKIGAFWRSKNGRPGSYSGGRDGFSVYDERSGQTVRITKLVLEDGRSIALADYWLDATHWDEKNGTPTARQEEPSFGGSQAHSGPSYGAEPQGYAEDDQDDIPF